ncbi:hypothetical protein Tcan_01376 [Toxocara canis]|uniref:Uncharacterized protein n=1 Tax=Toxocara canis TaxID=6265 RepID=A0A0B2W780_TOXCA|nr:hypothetical protein Tcan_01376 [Toxocara canis]
MFHYNKAVTTSSLASFFRLGSLSLCIYPPIRCAHHWPCKECFYALCCSRFFAMSLPCRCSSVNVLSTSRGVHYATNATSMNAIVRYSVLMNPTGHFPTIMTACRTLERLFILQRNIHFSTSSSCSMHRYMRSGWSKARQVFRV